MIKKLRIRLITVSMLSLLIVLVIIMGIANILNYRGILSDADSVLEILKKTDGTLPEEPERIDWHTAGTHYRSPELPFEIRFFSAVVNGDGEMVSSNTDNIWAVDSETVAQFATVVMQKKADNGFVEEYRYIRYAGEDDVHIIFLDCGRQIAGYRHALLTTIGVCMVGYAAVFILIFVLSRRIVKPFSRNYENQRRFITDAGHELKTPITIINADSELLELEIGDNEWLKDIQLQTNRLSELTHNLISLSRMEEQVALEMIEFPVSDIVADTVLSFNAPSRAAGKHFSAAIQPDLSMYGNEKSVSQLVTILLDNALKYSEASGSIAVSLARRGRNICISCENTVDSISQETVSSMFERFYRADSARRTESKGGYGIGLSIAKAIVEAHKGKISAETTNGKQITIMATFPMKQ